MYLVLSIHLEKTNSILQQINLFLSQRDLISKWGIITLTSSQREKQLQHMKKATKKTCTYHCCVLSKTILFGLSSILSTSFNRNLKTLSQNLFRIPHSYTIQLKFTNIDLRNCELLQMEVDAWWPSFQGKNLSQVEEEKSEINVEK